MQQESVTNPAVQEQYAKLLQWLGDTLIETKDFVIDQAPDIAREIILIGRFWCVVGLAFILVGASLVLLGARKAKRWAVLDDGCEKSAMEGLMVLYCIGGIALTAVGFATATCHVNAFLAPKLWVLQYVKDLL